MLPMPRVAPSPISSKSSTRMPPPLPISSSHRAIRRTSRVARVWPPSGHPCHLCTLLLRCHLCPDTPPSTIPAPHAAPPVAAEQPIITTNPLRRHDDNLLPGAQLPSSPLVGVFVDKKHKAERVPRFYAGIASFNPIIATAVNHTDMCLTRLNGDLQWHLQNCRNGRLLTSSPASSASPPAPSSLAEPATLHPR
ncbi:hypothetical protein ZWY2020_010749 [Hordeum vulgare]|nr:hypothetical protein ZWY2020_010749 [Hordeum vulgare]